MREYLYKLRNLLKIKKNVNSNIDNVTVEEVNDDNTNFYASLLGKKIIKSDLVEKHIGASNVFDITSNKIYFYPPNDGMPTFPYEFYFDNRLVIDNENAFRQITNLDEILIEMTRLMNLGLEKHIILSPYNFMLELEDEIKPNYVGRAKLLLSDKTIINDTISIEKEDAARIYFINRFLDHFMGRNFGLSITKNKELKNALDELNEKLINKKLRVYAGNGYDVFGRDDVEINGILHYHFYAPKDDKKILKR